MSKEKGTKRKPDEEEPASQSSEKKQKKEGEAEKSDNCHFEIAASDFARAKKFYTDLFGFKFTDWNNYPMFSCPDPKKLGGGLVLYEGVWPDKPISLMYLHCKDIGQKFDDIFRAGGTIYQNQKSIDPSNPDVGAVGTFQDCEGGFMGLWMAKGGKYTEVKTVKQTVNFKLKPSDIYAKFTDSKSHAEFSGAAAEISSEARGYSKLYGGKLETRNIELQPNKKIVQSWRSSDWPVGHFSKLTIELKSKKGTELVLTHEQIPADRADAIAEGWYTFYWNKFGEGEKQKK
jgi:predicted enzyme related to lactoylglutathione lyase/uncharacterized protein YndB with AHSA1/START domain